MYFLIYSSNQPAFKQIATTQGLIGAQFRDSLTAIPSKFYEVRAVGSESEVEAEIKKFDTDTAYIVLNDSEEIVPFTMNKSSDKPTAKTRVEKFDRVDEPKKKSQQPTVVAHVLTYDDTEAGRIAYQQFSNLYEINYIDQKYQKLLATASNQQMLTNVKSTKDAIAYLKDENNKKSGVLAQVLVVNDQGTIKAWDLIDPSIQLLREHAATLGDEANKNVSSFITEMEKLYNTNKLTAVEQNQLARSASKIINSAAKVTEFFNRNPKPSDHQKHEIADLLKAFNRACLNFDAQVAKTPILKEAAAVLISTLILMLIATAIFAPIALATTTITAALLLDFSVKAGILSMLVGYFLGVTVIPGAFKFFRVDSNRNELYSVAGQMVNEIGKQDGIEQAKSISAASGFGCRMPWQSTKL